MGEVRLPSTKRFAAIISSVLIMSTLLTVGASVLEARPADADIDSISGFRVNEFARGLNKPTSMNFAPDGRLFVTEKEGTLRVVTPAGDVLSPPALTLAVNYYRERGLLSVEFDAAFPTNGYIYIYYTSDDGGCHNQVSRFTMTGNTVDPASELPLINIGPCGSGGHNGGALHRSSDGKLFIQVGEQNIGANAQKMDNLFGKVLRINADGSIPTDNPFYGSAAGRNRAIWALGFRNPFTGGLDPGTGDYFVNDVGHMSWEEINQVQRGGNYGWPTTEGDFDQATYPNFTRPVYAYPHGGGQLQGCAIVGGTFYPASSNVFPAQYGGDWFFADYCSSNIRVLDRQTGNVSVFATGIDVPVDLDVGPDGFLYALDRIGGPALSFVRRFEPSTAPGISKQPTSTSAAQGTTATFRVIPSGDGPFTFQWFRNDVPVGGSGRFIDVTANTANNGARYRVQLTNAGGSFMSKEVTLTVVAVGNELPVPTIQLPTDGSLYRGGQSIAFSGTGTDTEDGILTPDRFSWEVVFHHDQHTHPFLEPFSGVSSGSFVIPNDDETATNVWYRVHLTVIDSLGDQGETYVDILPDIRNITLSTLPGDFTVLRNGEPTPTPSKFTSVVGVKQPVEAPATASFGGTTWAYDTWLDANPRSRTIVTEAGGRHYRANYHVDGGTVGSGNGLLGTYYDDVGFTGLTRTRDDRVVFATWRGGKPQKDIAPSSYSVRWTGTLLGQFSESYKFYVPTKNGIRVLIDGQPVIDALGNTTYKDFTATKSLVAGQSYTIEVQLVVPGDTGVARLEWSSPSTPRSLVPKSQLGH
jgi:glucose/arabinose dehydrogenase